MLFFLHVNQSSSCIRSCRTDLVIIFPVIFFACFRIHLLYFKLSFLASFLSSRLLIVFFLFSFAVILFKWIVSKDELKTVRECLFQVVCKDSENWHERRAAIVRSVSPAHAHLIFAWPGADQGSWLGCFRDFLIGNLSNVRQEGHSVKWASGVI